MRIYGKCLFPILLGALLSGSGCRKEDPFYLPNRPLIRILDAQDKLTGAAERYVVRGGDGHLFYLEDLRAAVTKWPDLEANAAMIGRLAKALDSMGTRLLVVPVPTKVEVYPELLGGRNASDISPS
jgi:hypothetical protein